MLLLKQKLKTIKKKKNLKKHFSFSLFKLKKMTKTKNSKFNKNYIDILKKNKHDKNNTKLLKF